MLGGNVTAIGGTDDRAKVTVTEMAYSDKVLAKFIASNKFVDKDGCKGGNGGASVGGVLKSTSDVGRSGGFSVGGGVNGAIAEVCFNTADTKPGDRMGGGSGDDRAK